MHRRGNQDSVVGLSAPKTWAAARRKAATAVLRFILAPLVDMVPTCGPCRAAS